MGLLRDYNIYSVEEAKRYGFKKAWFVWFSNIGQGNDFFAVHKSKRVLSELIKDVKNLLREEHKSDVELEEKFFLLQSYYEDEYKVDFFSEGDVGHSWRWDATHSTILASEKFDDYIAYEYKVVSLY